MQDFDSVGDWAYVPNSKDWYMVSDRGFVKSAARTILGSDGKERKYKEGSPHRGDKNPDGYRELRMSFNCKRVTISIARTVLEVFGSPCPDGMEVCHNNGIRDDNRLENLRWDTHKNNIRDIYVHGNSWQQNTSHCPAGHEYIEDNCVPSTKKAGSRGCLACNRANRNIKDNPEWVPLWQEISDMQFERIRAGDGWFRKGELKRKVESLMREINFQPICH